MAAQCLATAGLDFGEELAKIHRSGIDKRRKKKERRNNIILKNSRPFYRVVHMKRKNRTDRTHLIKCGTCLKWDGGEKSARNTCLLLLLIHLTQPLTYWRVIIIYNKCKDTRKMVG